MLPQPILDEVAVVPRDQRAIVDLDGKARRRGPELGDVVHLEALAALHRQRTHGRQGGQGSVELTSRNMGVVLVFQRGKHAEELADAATGDGRNGDHQRALAKLSARDAGDLLEIVGHRVLAEIGLVDGDHGGAVAPGGLGGDGEVELAETHGGVHDDHGDVGAIEALDAAQVRVVLDAGDLARFAHAGGVDEAEGALVRGHGGIDGVTSRAGDIAHDCARLTQDGVEQAGLAGVGTAHDGDRDLLGQAGIGAFHRASGLGHLDETVEQVACAQTVHR